MERNGQNEKKVSESELRLLSSFFPELLKEVMIQVEKERVSKMAVALYARISAAMQAGKALPSLTSYCKYATGAGGKVTALRWNTLDQLPLLPTTNGQYFSR